MAMDTGPDLCNSHPGETGKASIVTMASWSPAYTVLLLGWLTNIMEMTQLCLSIYNDQLQQSIYLYLKRNMSQVWQVNTLWQTQR